MEAALNCEETPLSPPLKVAYHKRLMKAAAQHTRNHMIVHSPNDPLSRLAVLRSISRAVWNQTVGLAQKVYRSHPLGRRFLDIDVLGNCVRLLYGDEFLRLSNAEHSNANERAQGQVRAELQESPERAKAKLRRKLTGLIRRGKLWPPINRSLPLQGPKQANGYTKGPEETLAGHGAHWGQ
eukprot:463888-Pyramimonas_sp.AAC.1